MGDAARVHLPVVYAPPVRVRARARTQRMSRYPLRELAREAALYPEQPGRDYHRPRTRGECVDMTGPCPFVSCKHHLALDVTRQGNIKLNHPSREVDEIPETCALRVADRGGLTLEAVAAVMNITREAVRLIEDKALAKVRASLSSDDWTAIDDALDHLDESRGERW